MSLFGEYLGDECEWGRVQGNNEKLDSWETQHANYKVSTASARKGLNRVEAFS